MSRKLKQRIQNSKVYGNNWLSLTQNCDLSHQKMWNQKNQEAKHIQQQKQIDRILYGIVKQRLFGNLLSQDTRISNQGFYALDRLNKELLNPVRIRNSRKIEPLKNQPLYQLGTRSRIKHKTIDVTSSKAASKSMMSNYNQQGQQLSSSQKRVMKTILQLNKTKKSFYQPKHLQTSKLNNFQSYFRQLTQNQSSAFYDLKITKESLMKYNKQKSIVSSKCLQRFLYFFNFNGPLNFKQYCNWVQNAVNCQINQSSFFVFQVLDQSKNGLLTISDLFRALQDFPLTTSSQLEKQIYQLLQRLKQMSSIQSKIYDHAMNTKQKKSTVQQIIVTNHLLKLEQMRQLVKQSSKQLISANCVKSTSYHNSMYALQHNASAREKNLQLEYSEHHQNLKDQKLAQNAKKQGLKFSQFANIFKKKRSQIFMLVVRILIGEEYMQFQ